MRKERVTLRKIKKKKGLTRPMLKVMVQLIFTTFRRSNADIYKNVLCQYVVLSFVSTSLLGKLRNKVFFNVLPLLSLVLS